MTTRDHPATVRLTRRDINRIRNALANAQGAIAWIGRVLDQTVPPDEDPPGTPDAEKKTPGF